LVKLVLIELAPLGDLRITSVADWPRSLVEVDLRHVFNEERIVVSEATCLWVLKLVLDAAKVLRIENMFIDLVRGLPLSEKLPVVLI
jgi:hypothetical protein